VYERAGFVATKKIKVNTNGGVYDFVVMELKKGDMNDDCRIFYGVKIADFVSAARSAANKVVYYISEKDEC
jgi:hypothetical protein